MKKMILLKACAVLMVVFAPLSLLAVNTIIHNATYDFSNLTVGTDTLGGVTYTTVQYEGLYNYGEPGMPSLPVDYLHFSVPWNATNFTVTSALRNNYVQRVTYLVYPYQPLRLMCDTTPEVIALPDSSAYYSNTYYPTHNAWIADEGFLAGENHIVTVAVMPVSYRHTKIGNTMYNELKKSQTVRLTLSYDLSDSLAMYPIVREDTALRAEGYKLAQSMVVNPANVQAYAPTDIMQDSLVLIIPNSGDGLNGGLNPGNPIADDSTSNYYGGEQQLKKIPYLIVTTPELLHSARRIAALKGQKGYNVKVVTMQDVLNSPYSGQGDVVNNVLTYTDNAGKLRQYLRQCYRKLGTEYVLLAGNGVPYYKKTFFNKTVPSDLYFSDYNADWSAGATEKSPEVFVGRLLADCSDQITNYTDKLFRYEINPGRGDVSFLKRALFTEGHDMHRKDEIMNLQIHSDSIFSSSCIMVEDTTTGVRFPTGVDVVNEINAQRYGYLSFHNHAYPTGILTYGHRSDNLCQDDPPFNFLWAIDTVHTIYNGNYKWDVSSGNGLNCLTNMYYPSICYSIACSTIPYDTIQGYETVKMNFGQSFTVGGNYGGVAFLGNTREGYIKTSSQLEESFIQQLIKGNYKLGSAEAISKVFFNNDYLNSNNNGVIVRENHYFSCVHNLLGDPEFEMWTDIPQQYSNISINRNNNSISISGISADSTIVAIHSNNGVSYRLIADSPNVTVNADPNSTIMLYRHNSIPYIAPLVLQKVSLNQSQYVIASDVTAGKSVDINRMSGNVIVKEGAEYEIEASGTVILYDGFKVEKGATFAVYPSCF